MGSDTERGKIMKLCCIADTHGMHERVKIPESDVLIVAGDVTGYGGQWHEVELFIEWLKRQPAEYCIFVAGNHDKCLQNPGVLRDSPYRQKLADEYSIFYLQDSEVVINDVKFYGSPWTPRFFNWSFMYDRNSEEAELIWQEIPSDTNVLITHGPPHGILDESFYKIEDYPQICGCEVLSERIRRVQPDIHCFGHLHEQYGHLTLTYCGQDVVNFFNCSTCNLDYKPLNKPFLLEYTEGIVSIIDDKEGDIK